MFWFRDNSESKVIVLLDNVTELLSGVFHVMEYSLNKHK